MICKHATRSDLSTVPGMDAELDHIVALELELLTPGCRSDRRRVGEVLHEDFVEHGASGRIWTRSAVLADLEASPAFDGTTIDIAAVRLTDNVVLVTYRIVGPRPSLRSSVWVGDTGGWKLRFHQGTLTDV